MRSRRHEKKENTSKMMVIFLAFIMIGSAFGVIFYGFNQQQQKTSYGNYHFTQKNDIWFQWFTNIDGKETGFNYLPQDVSVIPMNVSPVIISSLVQADVTVDPDADYQDAVAVAEKQMEITLGSFNIYVREGFTKENDYNWSVITCDNSTTTVPVIYFMESNRTAITQKGSCIIAGYMQKSDIPALTDRIVYRILGVLDG